MWAWLNVLKGDILNFVASFLSKNMKCKLFARWCIKNPKYNDKKLLSIHLGSSDLSTFFHSSLCISKTITQERKTTPWNRSRLVRNSMRTGDIDARNDWTEIAASFCKEGMYSIARTYKKYGFFRHLQVFSHSIPSKQNYKYMSSIHLESLDTNEDGNFKEELTTWRRLIAFQLKTLT